MEIIFQSAPFQ